MTKVENLHVMLSVYCGHHGPVPTQSGLGVDIESDHNFLVLWNLRVCKFDQSPQSPEK